MTTARESETPRKPDEEFSPAIMSHSEKMRSWWKLYEDAAAIEKKLIACGKLAGAA